MKSFGCIVFFLVLLTASCPDKLRSKTSEEFCNALKVADDDHLRKSTSKFFKTLSKDDSKNENLEHIKLWIESYNCVEKVSIGKKTIATNPPLVDFQIVFTNKDLKARRLWISFSDVFTYYSVE